MRVLGLSGSLRGDSHNAALLRTAGALLPAPAVLSIWNGLASVPPYDEDLDHDPVAEEARKLRDALGSCDALLIATPEYNSSVPGQLKNALDWASRPFPDNSLKGLPTAVIGASTGLFGAVWAQAELRKILAACGARVVALEFPLPQAHSARHADRCRLDDEQTRRLLAVLDELTELAAFAGSSTAL